MVILFLLSKPEFDVESDFHDFEIFASNYQNESVQKRQVNQYRLTKGMQWKYLQEQVSKTSSLIGANVAHVDAIAAQSRDCGTPVVPSARNSLSLYDIPDNQRPWLVEKNFFDVTNRIIFPITPNLINFPNEPWTPIISCGPGLEGVYRRHGSEKAFQIAFKRDGALVPSYVVIQCDPLQRRNNKYNIATIVMERFRVSNYHDAIIMLELLCKILQTRGNETFLTINEILDSKQDMFKITDMERDGEKLEDETLRQLKFLAKDGTFTYTIKPANELSKFDLLPSEMTTTSIIKTPKLYQKPGAGGSRIAEFEEEEKEKEGWEDETLTEEQLEDTMNYYNNPILMERLRRNREKFHHFFENEGNDGGEDPGLYDDRSGNT
jgi:hypothetical protein